jgi:hypothetical protein
VYAFILCLLITRPRGPIVCKIIKKLRNQSYAPNWKQAPKWKQDVGKN